MSCFQETPNFLSTCISHHLVPFSSSSSYEYLTCTLPFIVWPQLVNNGLFTVESFTWHGEPLKRPQLADTPFYNTHRNALRRTVSNTNAFEPSENHSSSSLCNANIYIRWVFVQGSIPKYILISPASTIYALSAWIPKNQPMPTITIWFHIRSCSHLSLPQSSANVCHTPGRPQARPHDAMHLPSLLVTCVVVWAMQVNGRIQQ